MSPIDYFLLYMIAKRRNKHRRELERERQRREQDPQADRRDTAFAIIGLAAFFWLIYAIFTR